MQDDRIYLSAPYLSGSEKKHIDMAIEQNWVSPCGPQLNEFEKKISEKVQKHTLALNSGTSAIHLALRCLGVEQGDTVFCSDLTFIGSVSPVLFQGATPVFIGSEKETWNMCPEALEKALRLHAQKGKLPKAIIVVDLYGMSAKYDEIITISKSYGVPIVEDAAEALGAIYKGQQCGSFGDLSIFSFNGNKIITSSGGGMLCASNKEYVDYAKFLSTQAKDKSEYYEHSEMGYNYRLSNICAAIGLGQLEILDDIIQIKREHFNRYKEQLPDILVDYQRESHDFFHTRWLSVFMMKNSESVKNTIEILSRSNIEARRSWKPMHTQPLFSGTEFYGDRDFSRDIFEKAICLPSGAGMTEDQRERVITSIKASITLSRAS